jgi:anti-sigma regulatory factor (Ser/Thr protein kinase)
VLLVNDLGVHPSHVGRARRLISAQLADWRVNGETGEWTVLLVSELVTNAMQHGGAPIRLVADTTSSGVRVEVYDGNSEAFPAIRDTRPDAPGGNGLRLVDALADRWGSLTVVDGKCVWFEIDVRGATMSQPDPGDAATTPVEASEADVAEQLTPVAYDDTATSAPSAAPPLRTADVEADEADLAEQSIAVPLDEDEQR